MEQQLRRAIRQDRLRVVYQPIVGAASGRVVALKAGPLDGRRQIRSSTGFFVKIAGKGICWRDYRVDGSHVLRECKELLLSRPDFG